MLLEPPEDLSVRKSEQSDHKKIIAVLKYWWGGRDLTWMVPKLFLIHFCNTSFIVEKEGELIAFLIGFLSQSEMNEGYIHFAGVHPNYRGAGLGRYLYNQFFNICRENIRDIVKCCTSPVNKGSIGFHNKIGFRIMPGNAEIDGIQVTLDYNKPKDPKVLFAISI